MHLTAVYYKGLWTASLLAISSYMCTCGWMQPHPSLHSALFCNQHQLCNGMWCCLPTPASSGVCTRLIQLQTTQQVMLYDTSVQQHLLLGCRIHVTTVQHLMHTLAFCAAHGPFCESGAVDAAAGELANGAHAAATAAEAATLASCSTTKLTTDSVCLHTVFNSRIIDQSEHHFCNTMFATVVTCQ